MADAALEAKLLLPEPFNGTGVIQAYITQFELLSSLQNWLKKALNTDGTDRVDASGNPIYIDKRHQVFPLRLKGSAIEFYQSLDAATKGDYKELRKQFLRQYQEPPEFFRSSLAKRVQGESEKVSEFLADLKLLASKAYPAGGDDVRNHIVLQKFIDGLNNMHVRVELRKLKPASIEDALEGALHYDAIFCLENSTPSAIFTPHVNAIDVLTQKLDQLLVGQLESRSRSFDKRQNRSTNGRNGKNFRRPSPGFDRKNQHHRSSSRNSSSRSRSFSRSASNERKVRFTGTLVCYGCNREGHTKDNCRNCWNCGSSQHQRRNCPKLQSSSKR